VPDLHLEISVLTPLERLVAPGLDEAFPGARQATVDGEFSRVPEDITRAVTRLHWGMMSVSPGSRDMMKRLIEEHAPVTVRARALLPDGRTARIYVWRQGEPRRLSVAVRVGEFGDASREGQFVGALASTLEGRAKRQRGGVIRVPDWEEIQLDLKNLIPDL